MLVQNLAVCDSKGCASFISMRGTSGHVSITPNHGEHALMRCGFN
ncbi:predicted protein [Sclerotinia sclerotiorum 1980 UF-70]|uniref:Uncharacterized protein n=1 Tax=Sclerotinia sclerotiorum (strain ATCC 18683 / 1980 / Ss-1) TaxID=665079 RepID=A7F4G2_SCLS1|nr:predicted protein [Sclerotinia sclerotiorum 1980 UF-70]EDN97633.1 predicted protein [Sclerotinia sclerotiorum 1980 UF-70]